jgi:hypothetical protein
MGSGNRACVESATTPARATDATVQDCGGYFGSGHRTCAARAAVAA